MADCVVVGDSEIQIHELSISNKDSAAFLSRVPEEDRVSFIQKAIEIGLFCLERGQNLGDLEFVRRQVSGLLTSVETSVGAIPDRTERALLLKIGIGDGQVLAPLKTEVDNATTAIESRIQEVKSLLENDLDPKKTTTVLGQALSAIQNLLDPKRTDSVQTSIETAVNKVVQPDGSLAKTVEKTVGDAIKSLQEEVNRLTQELHGAEMVEDALAQTTAKGATFEDETAVRLQQWAKNSGYSVEQVGPDNQPGDFVIAVQEPWATTGPIRIVIEARDRQNAFGRQKIAQDLESKFRERKAHFGVYISKTQAGLAKEIGDWAEGQCNSGPWVACLGEHLLTAVRFAVAQQRLKELKQSQPDLDAADIRGKVGAIRTCMQRIRTIKTKVTNIRDSATGIESESESLQIEIGGYLSEIETALLKARKPPVSVSTSTPVLPDAAVQVPVVGASLAEA